MRPLRFVSTVPILLASVTATAQNTVPHFSTYFGGAGRDVAQIVRRSDNGEITVVGYTSSQGLATAGAFQPAIVTSTAANGDVDAFVARFVPLQPGPGYALSWCTYLGGSGFEMVFDAEVDSSGVTTVVGLSTSTDFPAPTGIGSPVLNGTSDGFLAQIDPSGSVCLASMFFGGPFDDRICEVELDPTAGVVTISGIVEDTLGTTNLPNATNAHNGGSLDVFAARVVPLANPPAVLWSTYLGGNNLDGMPFASWTGFGMWVGNLDRMGMALDHNGDPAVLTASFSAGTPAVTTANAFQPAQAGQTDNYLAVLDATTGTVTYATFFGGSDTDRPRAIASHPAGGFVFGGSARSMDYPVTNNCFQPGNSAANQRDAVLSWLDPQLPAAQQLRYSTYFGGSNNHDNLFAVAVESSGVVTFAGLCAGAIALTPRSWQANVGGGSYGYIARLEPAGLGTRDLHYSSLVGPPAGGTALSSVALDDFGDAWMAGQTSSASYRLVHPSQPVWGGGLDAVLTHLPILPGGIPGTCVVREELMSGTSACGTPAVPLHTGVAWPAVPGTAFGITATDAPPSSAGLLVLGTPRAFAASLPLPFNGWLLVDSLANAFVLSDAQGYARVDLTMPSGPAGPLCWGLGAQWFFLTNAACPGTGALANSERLVF